MTKRECHGWYGKRDSNSHLAELKSAASAVGLLPHVIGIVEQGLFYLITVAAALTRLHTSNGVIC